MEMLAHEVTVSSKRFTSASFPTGFWAGFVGHVVQSVSSGTARNPEHISFKNLSKIFALFATIWKLGC
jgi:hypothetical protein